MRILTLAHDLHTLGGLERCQLAACTELARRGHEISLVYLRDGDLHGEWDRVASREVRVEAMRVVPQQPARSSARFARAVRRSSAEPIDLVFASHYRQLQLGAAIARWRRVPLVFHVHNVAPASLGPVGRRQVRLPDRSVVVSRSNADLWWSRGLVPETTRIVHNGVDAARFRPATPARVAEQRVTADLPTDGFVVAFVGGTADGKGAGDLLDAWDALAMGADDGRLLILGRPDRDLRRRLASLTGSAASTVRVIGQQLDVVPWLQLSDVVAAPSNGHDPCPLAVLEGLACGRPVVGCRIGGIPELLTGGLAALLVEPGDVAALAARLEQLHADPARRAELGSLGRRHVLDRFTLDRMVDDLEVVFAEVAQPTARGTVPSPS